MLLPVRIQLGEMKCSYEPLGLSAPAAVGGGVLDALTVQRTSGARATG